ncbi:MAG: dihydroorotate dehydrogenase [Candidatus Omnitrophica bacterium]|nr:dihydroorotate dehydrogenase [Candidatus Omnitrophota bacterium]
MTDLKVKIGDKIFDNPLWVASGTFGYGEEFADFLDLAKVGAIVAKTVTFREREGNPPPRTVETASGLLNSIGLENKGIEDFKKKRLPFLRGTGSKVIASIAGEKKDEFAGCAGELSGEFEPDALEVNLSCPNIGHDTEKYALIAQDARTSSAVIKAVRKRTGCPLIAKLTPNVTDITEIAKAVEEAGADAVALVNTYMGMSVDAETMRPVLGNMTGGLSGPAIKPLALKAVRDTYKKVRIPVIGIGGIMTGTDVAEFMLAGASAVQLGTSNLIDPSSYIRVLGEFEMYLQRHEITRASDLTGKLRERQDNAGTGKAHSRA